MLYNPATHCSCIILQQQHSKKKKKKKQHSNNYLTLSFSLYFNVIHRTVCAVLLQVKHLLCFVMRCKTFLLWLYR